MTTQTAIDIKSRPILMSAPMIRKILSGEKTQTRRVIKNEYAQKSDNFTVSESGLEGRWWAFHRLSNKAKPDFKPNRKPMFNTYCPFGKIGDRLWVRETWRLIDFTNPAFDDWFSSVQFKADLTIGQRISCAPDERIEWRSSIHLPKHLSRITLEITEIRVERLGDISEADAAAEGIKRFDWYDATGEQPETDKQAFSIAWDKINGKKYPFEGNPFVWVLEFKRVEG